MVRTTGDRRTPKVWEAWPQMGLTTMPAPEQDDRRLLDRSRTPAIVIAARTSRCCRPARAVSARCWSWHSRPAPGLEEDMPSLSGSREQKIVDRRTGRLPDVQASSRRSRGPSSRLGVSGSSSGPPSQAWRESRRRRGKRNDGSSRPPSSRTTTRRSSNGGPTVRAPVPGSGISPIEISPAASIPRGQHGERPAGWSRAARCAIGGREQVRWTSFCVYTDGGTQAGDIHLQAGR